jgi:hypothetical protein
MELKIRWSQDRAGSSPARGKLFLSLFLTKVMFNTQLNA